ncbi:MAG TPA: hypothetical protein VK689_18230, partial [Armatimonadota bacterium]|nr:hypothetical protein [Armatimonadota bacterium]
MVAPPSPPIRRTGDATGERADRAVNGACPKPRKHLIPHAACRCAGEKQQKTSRGGRGEIDEAWRSIGFPPRLVFFLRVLRAIPSFVGCARKSEGQYQAMSSRSSSEPARLAST